MLKSLLTLLLLATAAFAQQFPNQLVPGQTSVPAAGAVVLPYVVSVDPVAGSACYGYNTTTYNWISGNQFGCANGFWRQLGGSGGSPAFGSLTGQPTDNANLATALAAKQATLGASAGGNLSFSGATPSLIFPAKIFYRTAVCQAGTALAALSLPASAAPTANCSGTTNANYAYLTFTAASSQSAQDHFKLPPDWTGAIDVEYESNSSSTSASTVWDIYTGCLANGAGTNDVTWNTVNQVTGTSSGTANQLSTVTATAIPTTGCSAGNDFFFKVALDATSGATSANLIALRFTVRRAL